jgi:HAD superfamily hydrolase (TIGR01450 family)
VIRHYLVDIEGVLVADKRYRPIAGVVDWLNGLQDQGIGWRLVSNNTTHRPEDLLAALREAGFALAPERLVGALGTGLAWLERSGHRRLGWLGAASLRPWLVERGFEPVDRDAGSCDAVVLGVNPELTVDDLDLALRWLQGGAVLLCLHRNRLWLDAAGAARLGPGAWAAALEVAVPAARTLTAGKPEPAVYLEALESLGASPAEALFISDDPFSDLAGARRLGLATVMVLSGKYPDRAILDELPGAERPDLVLDRADQLRRDMLP